MKANISGDRKDLHTSRTFTVFLLNADHILIENLELAGWLADVDKQYKTENRLSNSDENTSVCIIIYTHRTAFILSDLTRVR